jgi:hypothetical protein
VLHRVSIASTSHCGFLNAGFWELRAGFCEEIPVNRLLGFLPNHSSKKLCLLYTAPHNLGATGFVRVNNWQEVAEYFAGIEG